MMDADLERAMQRGCRRRSDRSVRWMVPGEAPGDCWKNTGCGAAVAEQAARDGGLTGNDDPFISFYHHVPLNLAEQAMNRELRQSRSTRRREVMR